VFTLPAEVAEVALQNKAAVYDLLFKVAAETMLTIAADRKHLGVDDHAPEPLSDASWIVALLNPALALLPDLER
jgi:hypothetical protein